MMAPKFSVTVAVPVKTFLLVLLISDVPSVYPTGGQHRTPCVIPYDFYKSSPQVLFRINAGDFSDLGGGLLSCEMLCQSIEVKHLENSKV